MTDATIIQRIINRARNVGVAITVTEYRYIPKRDGIATGPSWFIDNHCVITEHTPQGRRPAIHHTAHCRCAPYSNDPDNAPR